MSTDNPEEIVKVPCPYCTILSCSACDDTSKNVSCAWCIGWQAHENIPIEHHWWCECECSTEQNSIDKGF